MTDCVTSDRRGTIAACLVSLLAAWPAGTASAQPVALPEGSPRTVAHGADERFSYVFEARAGRDYLVTVAQQGFDLLVDIEAPDGTRRVLDSPLLRDERELALIEDASAGAYTIRVHTEEHTGARGGHGIRLDDLTLAEPAVVDAWRLMSRGAAANVAGGQEAWADAAAAYEAAAQRWHALGRTREQAQALYAAGALTYWELYDWRRSAALAGAAAQLYDTLGEAALAANAVHLEGAALVERALEAAPAGESSGGAADPLFAEALQRLEQARRAHERLGNVYDLGLVLNNFGYTHFNRGEFDRARPYWQRAATLMRNADEWSGELNPIGNLAGLDAEEGNVASAIDSLERILQILPDGELQHYRAGTLDNLGIAHLMFGNVEQALQTFSSARDIQRQIDDLQGEGRTLSGMGSAYHSLGQLDLANTYLNEALAIARRTNDGRNIESILRNLGNIAYLEEDYAGALELHRRALEVVRSTSDRAYLQVLIARDLMALGRSNEAARITAEARATAEQSGADLLLADALHQAGRAALQHGGAASAIADLERAAGIYERLDLQAQHAEVLHSLALAAAERGQLAQAVEHGEASLQRLERLRVRVTAPELRAFFSSARRDYYESQIEFLMALDERADDAAGRHALTALETSERARARMISDLLQEAAIEIRYDAPARLKQRRDELYDRLAERSRQRASLLENGTDTARDERLSALLADIASIENELNLLEIELRSSSPDFASLNPSAPLTAAQMQALLDDESVLLQYAFAEQSSYVWVVTRDAATAVELAPRERIESVARRVVDGFDAYSPAGPARDALAEDMSTLAELVLVPVREHLDAPRLVLSLDGVLQYVPFSALAIRGADGAARRVLESHEIVRVPSMSALAALRGRDATEPAPKRLAVFADPVLGAADPRLASAPVTTAAATPLPSALRTSAPGADLQRLRSTGWEADAIAGLVAEDERLVARGFEASRGTVLQANLGEYQYIHFATHGLVDARYPALSALAMAQFDERGAPQEGLLRLHDIYELELNADLVVLSACETALGREVRGEGLLGLSQGFLYAGARSLIASLWQVPDRATSELMARFYGFLLHDGLAPAEALRRAQLAVAGERRWRDPYFWGGFVLLGDW